MSDPAAVVASVVVPPTVTGTGLIDRAPRREIHITTGHQGRYRHRGIIEGQRQIAQIGQTDEDRHRRPGVDIAQLHITEVALGAGKRPGPSESVRLRIQQDVGVGCRGRE